jgi:hypothetical protein
MVSKRINMLIAIPYRQPFKSLLHIRFTMNMSMNPTRKKIVGGSIIRMVKSGTLLILPKWIKSVQLNTKRSIPLFAWSNVPSTTPSDLDVRVSRVVEEISINPLFPDVR